MDVLTIVLIIMQALVGVSHGADKIKKHMDKKKKQKTEKVIKQTLEVSCEEEDEEE